MKIALPYVCGAISENFGSSREFMVIEAENKMITGTKILTTDENDHSNLISMLQNEGVEVIIANRVTRPLTEMLFYAGMEIITGAYGEAESAARDYLSGELVTGSACRGGNNRGN